jgi:hypothetical protein
VKAELEQSDIQIIAEKVMGVNDEVPMQDMPTAKPCRPGGQMGRGFKHALARPRVHVRLGVCDLFKGLQAGIHWIWNPMYPYQALQHKGIQRVCLRLCP